MDAAPGFVQTRPAQETARLDQLGRSLRNAGSVDRAKKAGDEFEAF